MADFKMEYEEKRWADPFPQYARKHRPEKYPMNEEMRKTRDLKLAIFQAKLYGKWKLLERAERERAERDLVLINGEPLETDEHEH